MGHDSKLNPFARENRLPPASVVRDQYNRILQVGDQVYVLVSAPLQPYEILAIAPVVDPRVPGDKFLDVTVRSVLRFRCAKDIPNPEFVRIAQKAEFAVPKSMGVDERPDAPKAGEEAELMAEVMQFPSEKPEQES